MNFNSRVITENCSEKTSYITRLKTDFDYM